MQTKSYIKIKLRSCLKCKKKKTRKFWVKGDLQKVRLWKRLSLQWSFGCSVLQGPEGCSVQKPWICLFFPFGDALFPKDILAPALIWHSRLTLVEPTKILGSNMWLCVFCFVAYLLVFSITSPTFKLIFCYGEMKISSWRSDRTAW